MFVWTFVKKYVYPRIGCGLVYNSFRHFVEVSSRRYVKQTPWRDVRVRCPWTCLRQRGSCRGGTSSPASCSSSMQSCSSTSSNYSTSGYLQLLFYATCSYFWPLPATPGYFQLLLAISSCFWLLSATSRYMQLFLATFETGSSDFDKILKIAELHVVLDWQKIYKIVLEKTFFFTLWRFYFFLMRKNVKNWPFRDIFCEIFIS